MYNYLFNFKVDKLSAITPYKHGCNVYLRVYIFLFNKIGRIS